MNEINNINNMFKKYNHKHMLLETTVFNNQQMQILKDKYGFTAFGLLYYLLLKLNYSNNKLNIDLLIKVENLSKEHKELISSYVGEGLLDFNEKAGAILFSKELMLNNYNYRIKTAEDKIYNLNMLKKDGYYKLKTFEDIYIQYYRDGDFNIIQEYIYKKQ